MTQYQIFDLMNYNHLTGLLTWKKSANKKIKIGSTVGSICKKTGYRKVKIDGKNYLCHRLIWLYLYGYIPNFIDHINHCRYDNRLLNLRECTKKENSKNKKLDSRNYSGFHGVGFRKRDNRWYANIRIDGMLKHLGYFISYSDAVNARKDAEILYGFHSNHGK